MTQSKVWLQLAELWDKAFPFELRKPTPHIMPVPDKEPCFGLCQSVARLATYNRIDARLYHDMRMTLGAYLEERNWNGAYLWPLDEAGAKLRAAACREMARETKS